MGEKKYLYAVSFGIEDIAENPNSSLSTKCADILLDCESDKLTVPELFILEKNDKRQKEVREKLWNLFREMIKDLYNYRRKDKTPADALENAEKKAGRINFDCEFDIYIPQKSRIYCRSQFKFSSGWEYVTVVLKTGSANRPKIIKKTDQHWLDFFEVFSKNMGKDAIFDDILKSIEDHALGIINRN